MASASTAKRLYSEFDNGNNPQPPAKKPRQRAHRLVYTPGEYLFRVFKPGKRLKVYIKRKFFDFEETNWKLWGTDVYMVDSDLLAAALHAGKVEKETLLKTSVRGVIIGVEIVPGQKRYNSSIQNDIRSKGCRSENNGFVVESAKIIEDDTQNPANKNGAGKDNYQLAKQTLFLPNVTVVFNLSNEPCLKYTLNAVADRGHEPDDFTAHRFLTEVLFVETGSNRYELSYISQTKRFRWAQVLSPQSLDKSVLNRVQIPLTSEHLNVLQPELSWKDIKWGPQSLMLGTKEYPVSRIEFHKHQQQPALNQESEHPNKTSSMMQEGGLDEHASVQNNKQDVKVKPEQVLESESNSSLNNQSNH